MFYHRVSKTTESPALIRSGRFNSPNSSAVIAATGLFTPPHSISNDELVASFNAWVDAYNQENAAAIEAGELEAKFDELVLDQADVGMRFYPVLSGLYENDRQRPPYLLKVSARDLEVEYEHKTKKGEEGEELHGAEEGAAEPRGGERGIHSGGARCVAAVRTRRGGAEGRDGRLGEVPRHSIAAARSRFQPPSDESASRACAGAPCSAPE